MIPIQHEALKNSPKIHARNFQKPNPTKVGMLSAEVGFTLVEVLISLLLLALMSMVTFSALHLGILALRRDAVYYRQIESRIDTEQVLTAWLNRAYPGHTPPPVVGQTGEINFSGDQNSISFLTQAPQSVASGGMVNMRLWVTSNGPVRNLMVSARPELGWPDENLTQDEILLDHVSAANFQYWGPDQPEGYPYWHETWKEQQFLPTLIHIIIRFPIGDSRRTFDLTVAPRVRVDESCQFTALSDACLGR